MKTIKELSKEKDRLSIKHFTKSNTVKVLMWLRVSCEKGIIKKFNISDDTVSTIAYHNIDNYINYDYDLMKTKDGYCSKTMDNTVNHDNRMAFSMNRFLEDKRYKRIKYYDTLKGLRELYFFGNCVWLSHEFKWE